MSPEQPRVATTLALEIGVLAVVFPALNLLLFRGDPGFAGVSPHPMLLVTLVVVARYGLVAGMIAAFVLAAEYVLLGALLRPEATLHTLLSPPLATPLILLVPCTVFFGMLVQRHIDRRRKAEDSMARARAQLDHTVAELTALRDVNVHLGEKIVHSDTTLFLLFDHLKELSTLDRDQLARAALRMLEEIVHVESGSVWDLEGGRCRLRTHVGDKPRAPLQLPAEREADFDRHDVLAVHKLSQEDRGNLPLLTGRIRAGAAGPVIGYLTIDRLPLRFNAEANRLFALLVEWMSIATGNAIDFERSRAERASLKSER